MRNHYQEMLDAQYKNGYKNEDSWLELKPNRVHNTAGWKFRISSHPEDTQQAWNIVAEELKKEGDAYRAKVALPHVIEEFALPEDAQAGKMITIYTEKGTSPDTYKDMLSRIEQKLQEEGIRSGVDVQGDQKISGSSYMSYRNDKNDKGEYQDAEGIAESGSEQAHNPFGAYDPYESFDVQSYNVEIPELEPEVQEVKNVVPEIKAPEISKKILNTLPDIIAVNIKEDGSIGIVVQQTYSRTNLEKIGIEDTGNLSRANYDGMSDEIIIPKDMVDNLKIPQLSKPVDELDVSAKILKATGAVATELKEDGSIGILVAPTYSRNNLKTVGIENTGALSRVSFNHNFDEIIIPKEQVDKFEAQEAKSTEVKSKVTIGSLVEAFTKAISRAISRKPENTNKVVKKKSQGLKN